MDEDATTQQVEVAFDGIPPSRQIEQASGVSDVQVDGQIVRCLVDGSFQPFLESMRGHEVVRLSAIPVPSHVRRTT
jgi:hypothetical protein